MTIMVPFDQEAAKKAHHLRDGDCPVVFALFGSAWQVVPATAISIMLAIVAAVIAPFWLHHAGVGMIRGVSGSGKHLQTPESSSWACLVTEA